MEITPARQWALTQIIYEDALNEIDKHFNELQIPYMPIKGAYLICTGLAQQLETRTISDIDILVQEEHMKIVSDYFKQLSNTTILIYYTDNYRPTETIVSYTIGNVTLCLEIHNQLNLPERFLLPTEKMFADSIGDSTIKRLLSPEDSLLLFLCHHQSHIPFEFRTYHNL